jgi:glycosyltransferase involved in cell wall biosynthesis
MISIVIPAYNEERFIGTILESLAAQEIDEPMEVVVADANSKDGTRKVVESFRGRFANLKIVEGGMPGPGRNKGARASSGNPIVFLDADMELPDRNFLARNVGYFRMRGLAAATTKLSPQSDKWYDHLLVGSYNLLLRPAVFVRPLGSMCIVADREAFEKVGGYPEDVIMAEDHDFVLRCSKIGKYGILPVAAHFHIRRFDKEGRWGIAYMYLKATVKRVFHGPIKKFDYEFGAFGRPEDIIHHDRVK